MALEARSPFVLLVMVLALDARILPLFVPSHKTSDCASLWRIRNTRPFTGDISSDRFSDRTYVDRWGNTHSMDTLCISSVCGVFRYSGQTPTDVIETVIHLCQAGAPHAWEQELCRTIHRQLAVPPCAREDFLRKTENFLFRVDVPPARARTSVGNGKFSLSDQSAPRAREDLGTFTRISSPGKKREKSVPRARGPHHFRCFKR